LEEVERVSDAVIILDAGHLAGGGQIGELGAAATELEVQVEDEAAARRLVARLTELGAAAAATGGSRVVVALESPAVLDLVRDALADTGLAVRRLAPHRASLEDVYLASGTS
jgi:ABC-type uncharacterized transport system ATPase subunit